MVKYDKHGNELKRNKWGLYPTPIPWWSLGLLVVIVLMFVYRIYFMD